MIALIVSPNSPFDIDGSVKLSKGKATKVTKICSAIESLIPNTTLSLSQVLLSLSMHRKMGSSTVIDELHKFGHGISYTETKFVEDKWAEWSEQQSSLLPSNIEKGLITTLVFDNIDWKNRNHKAKETHDTNSILIQEIPSQCTFTRVNLNPNYDFERSKHRSFKAFETNLEHVTFKKSQCKDLIYKESNYEEEYNDSKNRILAWVMSRLTVSRHSEQSIPSSSHQFVSVADDTDVFILLLHVSINCNETLYFRQRTTSSRDSITYHNVTSLSSQFGGENLFSTSGVSFINRF